MKLADTALAREARELMRVRHHRWFVGEDACLRDAEDLWLTLEGTGQWVGYEWLRHTDGASATTTVAMAGFGRRSRWWSQNLGLALVRSLDRLDAGTWRRQAFGEGKRTVMDMFDAALGEVPDGTGTLRHMQAVEEPDTAAVACSQSGVVFRRSTLHIRARFGVGRGPTPSNPEGRHTCATSARSEHE